MYPCDDESNTSPPLVRPVNHARVLLHLFLLSGLAVAQPLFDLVGANPEFLVAHGLNGYGAIVFTLIPSLFIPLLLFLIYRILSFISNASARRYIWSIVAVFAAMVALPVIIRNLDIDGVVVFIVAAGFGLAVGLSYARFEGFRQFFTLFSILAIVFPVKFLFFSPASEMLGDEPSGLGGDRLRLERQPPIFLLVFDELPLVSLLKRDLKINEHRFPNFAALSEDASWYRQATTNSVSTLKSIPNLLSGSLPDGLNSGLPSLSNYPDNLFVLLGKHYQITAFEHGTALCPREYCGEQPVQHRLLVDDSLVLLGHIYSPPSLASRLPAINDDWLGFGSSADESSGEKQNVAFFKRKLGWGQRIIELESLDRAMTENPQGLNYMHAMLPHSSWKYLPDGRLLTADKGGKVLGIRAVKPDDQFRHNWYDSDALTRISRQRHLLQVGYVDQIVGRFISKLRELGLYEQSLVIITSDHGTSFTAGEPRRGITGDNLAEIAGIPLMIKYPGNRPSGTSDVDSQLMDILPTILDVLGAQGWITFDGVSLLERDQALDRKKVISSGYENMERVSVDEYLPNLRAAAQKFVEEYGDGDFSEIFHAGDSHGLVGKSVSEIPIQTGEAATVKWAHAEKLHNTSPGAASLQLVAHGEIESPLSDNPSNLMAVSVNGVIQGVNGIFDLPGYSNSFEVLLPPEAFTVEPDRIEAWFVIPAENGAIHLQATHSNQPVQYQLLGDQDGWALQTNDEWIEVAAGLIAGHCSSQPGNSHRVVTMAGWAADLDAAQPAESVLLFLNGKFHLAIAPNRNADRVAEKFDMPSILHSGFRFPLSIPKDSNTKDMTVQLFAISREGKASELVCAGPRKGWLFKKQPRKRQTAEERPKHRLKLQSERSGSD